MSDRVRFLTNNDTVTPANSSGCNGFPWPSTSPLYTPIDLTFLEQHKWWWRIRQWNIGFVGDIITNDGAGGHFFTNPISFSFDTIRDEASELDLKDGATISLGGGSTGAVQIWTGAAYTPINYDLSVSLLLFESSGQFQSDPFTHIYNPDFQMIIRVRLEGEGNSDVVTLENEEDVVGELDVEGQELVLYRSFASNSVDFKFDALILTMDPNLWWSYAALDSSSIYDTSDGSQLQDPRN